MFDYGHTSENSANTRGSHWAVRTGAKRRHAALRFGAALPILAVAVLLRGNAPALAEDNSPAPVAALAAAPAPVEVVSRWSKSDARDLLKMIDASQEEGLNPADYMADALRAAIDRDAKGPALDTLADAAARRLAHDYADGRIDDKAAFDWHITPPLDSAAIDAGLAAALADKRVDKWLASLLPANDQYRALKAAYAEADPATRERLRANLERWRWMPRELGKHYIYVNVPSYELNVINDGVSEATYNVVVGAPKTPTPQLALMAQSVVANPSWTLPPSVLKEGRWQNKGYAVTRRSDGSVSVRQAPGPNNALGRIKIDMPNVHAIYLHDTPNKAAFARENRALSHGCVRVQNIDQLATELHGGTEVDDALAARGTKVLQLEKSVPVYIVYFTAQADESGTVRYLNDPYARDTKIAARLGAPVQMASVGGAGTKMATR